MQQPWGDLHNAGALESLIADQTARVGFVFFTLVECAQIEQQNPRFGVPKSWGTCCW